MWRCRLDEASPQGVFNRPDSSFYGLFLYALMLGHRAVRGIRANYVYLRANAHVALRHVAARLKF